MALAHSRKPVTILMADDDPDDRLLTKEALEGIDSISQLDFVEDGVQLMAYLHRHGQYEHLQGSPLPALILLDLNMPKKNGLETLQEIKSDPHLRRIPIVVLTTSEVAADVYKSYDNGANSFISKSVTLSSLVEIVQEIGNYWLEVVELPPELPKRP